MFISIGAHYLDNTSGEDKLDDRIPYGHNRTMTWRILKEYSPTADDPNCLIFAVHSHNHAEYEVYAGLLTLMVSCKPGLWIVVFLKLSHDPRSEKTGLRDFRAGLTQTGLYSHRSRRQVESLAISRRVIV